MSALQKLPVLLLLAAVWLAIFLVSCGPSSTSLPPVTGQAAFMVNDHEITVIPGPGSHLAGAQREPSPVILLQIDVSAGVCDQHYTPRRQPIYEYEKGDPCIVVTGRVLNTDEEKSDIIIWADGLDAGGNKVSWTLDSYHLIGQTGLTAKYNETGNFTIHLNTDSNLNSIELYSVLADY